MKTLIYITGIACANLMMAGSLFKTMHWPGASIMIVLAVLLFCLLFLPAALTSNYRHLQKFRWLHIVTFIVFFTGVMSILFKVQHWPGAGPLLYISIPLPFVLFLPVYLYQTRKEKKDMNMQLSGILFGLTFLAVFSVLLALNA